MKKEIVKMPSSIDMGRTYEFNIETIRDHYVKYLSAIRNNTELRTTTADRYACGFPLPYFQRDLCWTEEQEIKFIESIWLGLYPGTYCVHETDWVNTVDNSAETTPFSGWLIDGQQRLTTIERYWDDEFSVFGAFYSELSKGDVRRFNNTNFKQRKVNINDEAKIIDLYNRLAFGGTAHKSNDIAVLKK